MTLSDPEHKFQGYGLVHRRISRMLRPNISSALCVYDGYTQCCLQTQYTILCLQTTYLHIQMTRTSRGPSATAELLVYKSYTYVHKRR